MMVTDVADEAHGVFHVWGNTPEGISVLLRVHNFQPYFYIAGPVQAVSSQPLSLCCIAAYRPVCLTLLTKQQYSSMYRPSAGHRLHPSHRALQWFHTSWLVVPRLC